MQKLSFREALHAGGLFSLLTRAFAVLVALGCFIATAWTQTAEKRTDLAIRPEFREPVVLASKEGVLEVRLTARQGQATLDTVATPVQNFLLFDYEVIRGTASDGQMSGGNLYPGPTLHVFPVAILCTEAWIEGTNSACGGHIASRHPLRLTPSRR